MQPSRRSFVATIAALSAASGCAGNAPRIATSRFLTCARRPDGSFAAVTLSGAGEFLSEMTLPDRGHSSAISPSGRHVVTFARRPGDYILASHIDGPDDVMVHAARTDRRLYGHGAFSGDGKLLYVSENAFDEARGVIGVYEAASDFKRIGEFPSGGVGPHQIALLNDHQTLAVANGGIETHPDYPRAKLNLATMRSNLSYIDAASGSLLDTVEPPEHLSLLSLRHLAQASDGAIWIVGQYEGHSGDDISLIAVHRRGEPLRFLDHRDTNAPLANYVGSIAANSDGSQIALTSPRGGCVQIWDARSCELAAQRSISDVCGVGATSSGFITSDGYGQIWTNGVLVNSYPGWSWDNHIVPMTRPNATGIQSA